MLSGGERNRLLLARLLTQPANVLILDEPTNDLDLETLSVLEAELAEFQGTVLVVSHDRVFLENVVTSTWLFSGDGKIEEHVGTVFGEALDSAQAKADAARAKALEATQAKAPAAKSAKPLDSAQGKPAAPKPAVRAKLSYKEQREFDALPGKIDALESEERALQTRVAAPDFYRESASEIRTALARVETIKVEIEKLYARWHELDRS
jgi:ATP-binding cassette subfamily F protein uup